MRASEMARRRAEPGWRAAVLDEQASGHAFRLRASEEGSGQPAPASASEASNVHGVSGGALLWLIARCRSLRIPSAMREQRTKGLSGGKAISQAVPCRFWSQTR